MKLELLPGSLPLKQTDMKSRLEGSRPLKRLYPEATPSMNPAGLITEDSLRFWFTIAQRHFSESPRSQFASYGMGIYVCTAELPMGFVMGHNCTRPSPLCLLDTSLCVFEIAQKCFSIKTVSLEVTLSSSMLTRTWKAQCPAGTAQLAVCLPTLVALPF